VEVEDSTGKFADGQAERDLSHSEYKAKIKDHNEAIAAIDEAYALIEHL